MNRPEMLPDHVVCGLRLLDPRKAGKANKDADGACGRNFQADAGDAASRGKNARTGLVCAVDSSGSPVLGLLVPSREGQLHVYDGERCIYHWMLFVAAMLRGKYSHGTLDVACIFKKWRVKVDRLSTHLQSLLVQTSAAARHNGASLREALGAAKDGFAPEWLADMLAVGAKSLKEHASGPAANIGEAGVLGIWQGMIFLLEVYGNVDVDVCVWANVQTLSLATKVVALDAMHAYCHGTTCRHNNDPRAIRGAGRQDGECPERVFAQVLTVLLRLASAGADEAKQIIAELFAVLQDRKMAGMASEIRRRMLASRKVLNKCALDLAHCTTEIEDLTPISATDDERQARSDLRRTLAETLSTK